MVVRGLCATHWSAVVAVVAVMVLSLFVASWIEGVAITIIDVSKQTTQDYAVAITNPPPDAVDPLEYHEFFKKFGEQSPRAWRPWRTWPLPNGGWPCTASRCRRSTK